MNKAILKLEQWIEKNGYEGYDPYDGLNSYLSKLTFNNKSLRYILMQGNRLFPINIRPILGIKKGFNPKGMALFALAYLQLYKKSKDKKYLDKAEHCLTWLDANSNNKYSGKCWGYNFDWENRMFFLPKGEPCIVVTVYVGMAFLEFYEITKKRKYLEIAKSISQFILKDLYMYKSKEGYCLSYTPFDKTRVYNASILGGTILAHLYKYTKDNSLKKISRELVRYVVNNQNLQGYWTYGDTRSMVDNFHTGFVLDSIAEYIRYTGDKSFEKQLKKGLEYYKKNLFTSEGIPKYYNNSVYPIDIHASAQAIITFSKFDKEFANKIAAWTIKNMQKRDGSFIYRINKSYKVKTPFTRWGQAWMLYALSQMVD